MGLVNPDLTSVPAPILKGAASNFLRRDNFDTENRNSDHNHGITHPHFLLFSKKG
jgi:hypothetical protein